MLWQLRSLQARSRRWGPDYDQVFVCVRSRASLFDVNSSRRAVTSELLRGGRQNYVSAPPSIQGQLHGPPISLHVISARPSVSKRAHVSVNMCVGAMENVS